MSYSPKIKASLAQHKRSMAKLPLGVQLGKLAVKQAVSVIEVAQRTGASRTTIYSWFAGHGVTNAYVPSVKRLIAELASN